MHAQESIGRDTIVCRLQALLVDAARHVRVEDVRIGLGYTAVMLEDGGVGVAYTFRGQAKGGCAVFNGIRPLRGRKATDLLVLLASQDFIEAGVGMACANALANRGEPGRLAGDILEHIDVRPEDRVAMVGHFGPLVGPLKRRVRSLRVFDNAATPTELVRPAQDAADTLPRCQVALITATSIINHTVDSLLQAARGCREVAILGASTPLCPEAFDTVRVTMLSGVVVRTADAVLQVVSEGGGMRQFSPHVHKVTSIVSAENSVGVMQ